MSAPGILSGSYGADSLLAKGQLLTLERVIDAPGSDDTDVKRAPRECYRPKNALERTALNCCERLVVTRYAFGKNVCRANYRGTLW